jgi:hypothetical protein
MNICINTCIHALTEYECGYRMNTVTLNTLSVSELSRSQVRGSSEILRFWSKSPHVGRKELFVSLIRWDPAAIRDQDFGRRIYLTEDLR